MSLGSFIGSTRRITTSGTWVPEVDGVRFLAIALVLIHHAQERVLRRVKGTYPDAIGGFWETTLAQGDVGVVLFFALSGYILGKSIIPAMDRREPISVGRFYGRRLTRLEPPYLVALLGIFALLTLSGGYQSQHAKSFNEGAQSLHEALGASMIYSYGFIYGKLPKLRCVSESTTS